MKPMQLVLGCSLVETLVISLIIASFNDFSLVCLAAPLGLASLVRTIAALVSCSRWGDFVARKSLALSNAFAVAAVTVFVYFVLVLRNSGHIVTVQEISVGNNLRAKVAVLLVCALGAAIATSLLLYITLRSNRMRDLLSEKDAETCSLTLEDITLRTFAFQDVADTAGEAISADCLDACCICLDEYCSGDMICELVCHHKFHKSCVGGWINADAKESSKLCPLRCAVGAMSEASTEVARVEDSV
eukprot:TRINITY_DN72788_c0_g1_i1.p1 TRINITY_DN72788_c0_g1~~TRINITY_DN72788_c0_g1_i1.p1  ORF type:complete len:245 (-),score=33.06 TRINITY_DN72788_c0_g1_i1:511-1245(-)